MVTARPSLDEFPPVSSILPKKPPANLGDDEADAERQAQIIEQLNLTEKQARAQLLDLK